MFLEWLNMYLCIICLNPGRLQCHFCIHPWLWREGACEQVGQAGTIKHFDKRWYTSTGDGCLRAWAMPAPGRRVRWDRTDPLLLFIQTLQVIGEREISGVLRITEQTSSLTPKNRWNFGLFRFYVVHWLSERTTWSGFQEMCQHWLRNFELCQSFLIWTWPVVKKLLKWVILF